MYKKGSSIILAAGRGKRLKDIYYPKSLIKILEALPQALIIIFKFAEIEFISSNLFYIF